LNAFVDVLPLILFPNIVFTLPFHLSLVPSQPVAPSSPVSKPDTHPPPPSPLDFVWVDIADIESVVSSRTTTITMLGDASKGRTSTNAFKLLAWVDRG